MKRFTVLMITVIQVGLGQLCQAAQAVSATKYVCEIQQMSLANGQIYKKTYAKAIIDAMDSKSKSLFVDMPRFQDDTAKMRVILDVGPSLDKTKVHVGFTGVDKHGSPNFPDWTFAFQMENEFAFGTEFISLQSNSASYMAEYSCSLVTR